MDATDDLMHHIWNAIYALGSATLTSHDAAVCEDRLREALMWAQRIRREEDRA